MDPQAADGDIIKSVLQGSQEDYAILVRRYQDRIFSLCRSFLLSDTRAEEAAQDVFVKAYENLKKFRGDSSFGTWAFRIAANHCKDLLRQTRREKSDSLEEMLEAGQENRLPSSKSPLSSALETSDLARRLLATLPEKDRLVLTLRELSGLSYAEISDYLDVSIDSIKARLQRARKEMVRQARHFLDPKNV